MINKFSYAIDLAYPRSIDLTVMHGESIELNIGITINGEPWTSTSNTIEMLWQDPSMGDSWYTTTASRTGSTVTVDWKGSFDTGAELYRWFIRLKGPGDDQSYRIFGKFRMIKSPGFVPNQLPKPTSTLDFSSFEVVNAPYYTKEYLDAELTRLKADIAALNGGEISASQIQDKDKTAGMIVVAWNEPSNGAYKQGYINYYFDPGMYNEGSGAFSVTIPNGASLNGVDIGGQLIEGIPEWEIVNDYPNWNGYIYRTKTPLNINGLELYMFASLDLRSIIAQDNSSTPAWVGIGLTKDPNDYGNTVEIVVAEFDSESYAPIYHSMYEQSGNYKLITERTLRDSATGEAYTLSVKNGELHLTPYRLTNFSGGN